MKFLKFLSKRFNHVKNKKMVEVYYFKNGTNLQMSLIQAPKTGKLDHLFSLKLIFGAGL